MAIPKMRLWKVRVQLVDPANEGAYREDTYEFSSMRGASDAAFNVCGLLAEEEGVVTINGEVPEELL